MDSKNFVNSEISQKEIQDIFGEDYSLPHDFNCDNQSIGRNIRCVARSYDGIFIYSIELSCPDCRGRSYYNVEGLKFPVENLGWKEG